MNKTLLIILGIAIAVGVAFFAFTSHRPSIVETVEVPAAPVQVTTPTATTPATPPATTAAPETAPAATDVDSVAATVNGTPIMQSALDDGVDSIIAQYSSLYSQMGQDFRSLLVGAEGFTMKLGIQVQALDRLAFDAIADAEVASRAIVVTDEELAAKFDELYTEFLASNNLTEESLTSLLAAQGMTLDSFKESGRKNIRESLLLSKLQVAVAGPIELTDEEIETFWETNKATYSTEEQVRASHILVKTEDEAKAVVAQLDGGADFAAVAAEKSLDASNAQKGGDLGFFSRGTMVTEFEDAAFALEPGQRSGIVQTEYGYHIILVVEKKAAVEPALADVRDQVVEDAKQEIVDERSNAWYSEVMASANIVIKDPILSAARQQQVSVDLGLAAFEAALESGAVHEPYVSYIIGTLYENKVQTLTRAKTQLEAVTPPETAKIAETAAQIEEARAKALAAYQEALAGVGADAAIQARIEAVQSASAAPEVEAQ